MRRVYTDHYAVLIWLPLFVGCLYLSTWWDSPEKAIKPLTQGIFWLLVAAIALFRRFRKPRHLR